MSKKLAVVVIPIHSEKPTVYELISLQQCIKVLYRYDIFVVAPRGLNMRLYGNQLKNVEILYIDPIWLTSVLQYNKLKLSNFFYSHFKNYQYLLTYELDAFVFRDELSQWCEKGFDFIGAPWFEGYTEATKESNIIGVGNSGFSLRKITTIRYILKNLYLPNPKEINSGRRNKIKAFINYPLRKFRNFIGENYTIQNYYNYHEDYFLSKEVPKYFPEFNIAPPEDALKFSFEANPQILFAINHDNLPFGCHAWVRYNLNFWGPYIENEGYIIS